METEPVYLALPRNPEVVAAEEAWHAAQEAAWEAEDRFYAMLDASRKVELMVPDRVGDF